MKLKNLVISYCVAYITTIIKHGVVTANKIVSDLDLGIGVGSPSFGMYKFVNAGFDISVVKTKKETKRNPRSTIGVMSILRFALLFV